jgi:large subunit ribosomal protein L25
MVETIQIAAETRDRAGKGAARATRRSGKIPGVIYGDGKAPILIAIDRHRMFKLLRDPAFMTHLYDIEIGAERHHCLARDMALDPVTDEAIHLDFLRVSDRSRVHATVPVQFVHAEAAPGIKIGGVLNVVRHDVDVICRADAIPDHLTLDLTAAEIGDSLRMSAMVLPDGVRSALGDRDFVIATIAAPTVMRDEAAEAQQGEGAAAPAAEPAKS